MPFPAGGIFKDLMEDGRFVLDSLGLHVDAAVRVPWFRERQFLNRVRHAIDSSFDEFEICLPRNVLTRKRQPASQGLARPQRVGVDRKGECHPHPLWQGKIRILLP